MLDNTYDYPDLSIWIRLIIPPNGILLDAFRQLIIRQSKKMGYIVKEKKLLSEFLYVLNVFRYPVNSIRIILFTKYKYDKFDLMRLMACGI